MKKDKGPTTAMAQHQKVKAQLAHDSEYWRTTLGTYEGRTVIWRILEMCGVFQDCGLHDLAGMAGFLGKRRVGLRVLAEIQEHQPNAYQMMEEEELARQTPTKGENL